MVFDPCSTPGWPERCGGGCQCCAWAHRGPTRAPRASRGCRRSRPSRRGRDRVARTRVPQRTFSLCLYQSDILPWSVSSIKTGGGRRSPREAVHNFPATPPPLPWNPKGERSHRPHLGRWPTGAHRSPKSASPGWGLGRMRAQSEHHPTSRSMTFMVMSACSSSTSPWIWSRSSSRMSGSIPSSTRRTTTFRRLAKPSPSTASSMASRLSSVLIGPCLIVCQCLNDLTKSRKAVERLHGLEHQIASLKGHRSP